MARKACQLSTAKGITALLEPLEGRKIGEEEQNVREFYEGDEYSRVMPGAKDKINIAKKHLQA
jgi:hypothetical protein